MAVQFSYADRKLPYNGKRRLKSFLPQLAAMEGRTLVDLNYVFCSDDFLLDINKRFLAHDYFTDIITFDLGGEGPECIDGEIYISVDRVMENSTQMNVSFEEELVRVVFHGLLHLCGYKDKTKQETATMRAAEDRYLSIFLGKV
jgi:probable rRNA maturation factor